MSLALYRKYRPASFAEVVGQEHVTEPLAQALRTDRVHHAYLFSGPRGCGKTSSARILARSLNCESGPTPDPCGECASCVALAPNGPGTLDVIEIDAATHGLVDDARELREKAIYAPAQSRYRIYIIDEAHQLGPGAANALLKIIEEPPSYLKFIFATTEPDKIIGTIRSRTHHYPFRLVPPGVLASHLAHICESEGVAVEAGVLPLVVRAGAGSVRDCLSVLDQLIGASGDAGITYAEATALLGFTPSALLDEVLDAIAGRDGAALFNAVDRVLETGVDPRRFAGDLLERFRDLMVLAQVPDAVEQGLLTHPDDQIEVLRRQSQSLSFAELTRAADVTADALTELKGATAPRLLLEILVARLLLPSADGSDLGVIARLSQVERLLAAGVPVVSAAPVPAPAAPPADSTPAPTRRSAAKAAPAEATEPPADAPAVVEASQPSTDATGDEPAPAPEEAPPVREPQAAGVSGGDLQRVRVLWADVLEAIKGRRRVTWMLLFEKAQVLDVQGKTLTLALARPGDVKAFNDGGHGEWVRQALIDVAGLDVQVQAVLNPAAAGTAAGRGGASLADTAAGAPASPPVPDAEEPPDDAGEAADAGDPESVLRALGATPVSD